MIPTFIEFLIVVSEEKILKVITSKTVKTSKKGNNSDMGQQIFTKITSQIDLIMTNSFTLCQNLLKPNGCGDICKITTA